MFWSKSQNLEVFCQQYLKGFCQHHKGFCQHYKGFGQNHQSFSQNLEVFGPNVLANIKNVLDKISKGLVRILNVLSQHKCENLKGFGQNSKDFLKNFEQTL